MSNLITSVLLLLFTWRKIRNDDYFTIKATETYDIKSILYLMYFSIFDISCKFSSSVYILVKNYQDMKQFTDQYDFYFGISCLSIYFIFNIIIPIIICKHLLSLKKHIERNDFKYTTANNFKLVDQSAGATSNLDISSTSSTKGGRLDF
jgi:hypothetical protein